MKSVIYVNLNPDMVNKIKPLLEEGGYRLISVPDGETAMSMICKEPVHFVMYDVEIALRNGAKPFLDLKAEFPNLPVVAVTPIKIPGIEMPEGIREKTKFDGPDGEKPE